jgi:hypothetical protein
MALIATARRCRTPSQQSERSDGDQPAYRRGRDLRHHEARSPDRGGESDYDQGLQNDEPAASGIGRADEIASHDGPPFVSSCSLAWKVTLTNGKVFLHLGRKLSIERIS